MSTDQTCNGSFWTKEEDKIFENGLAIYSGDDNQWMKIAAALPGKSLEEIIHHYELLVEDVNAIEAGNVPLPQYRRMQNLSHHKSRVSKTDVERRRGVAWTEEEHRAFLRGLEKYGRGDWRSISRHCVLSRTPTQVASHAQKFFSRLKAVDKEKRRTSIHDITIVDTEITGTSQVSNLENMIGAGGGGPQVANSSNMVGAFGGGPQAANSSNVVGAFGGGPQVANTSNVVGAFGGGPQVANSSNVVGAFGGGPQVANTSNVVGAFGGRPQIANTNSVVGAVNSRVVPTDVGMFNESMLSRKSTVAGGESSGLGGAFVNTMNSLYSEVNDEFFLGLDDIIMEQEQEEGTCNAGFLVDTDGRSQLPSKQPSTAAGSEIYSHPVTSIGNELEVLISEHMVEDNEINSIFDAGKSAPSHTMLSNAAHSGVYSHTVANVGAKNAFDNPGSAPRGGLTIHSQKLPFFAPSSDLGVGLCPKSNTSIDDEDIFDLEDLFKDPMI